LAGDDSTEIIIGMGIGGTTDGFLINILSKTGEAGIVIDIGKEKENGTSKNINPLHHNRSRNGDGKDSMNMDGDLRSRNMNNGNAKFINLKVNSKDNPRFNNRGDNLRREFSNRKDKSKDLRVSNHNTLSLKENLKEGRENIESRLTRGLKTLPSLPSIISVG
jgi:hypothetical protein